MREAPENGGPEWGLEKGLIKRIWVELGTECWDITLDLVQVTMQSRLELGTEF